MDHERGQSREKYPEVGMTLCVQEYRRCANEWGEMTGDEIGSVAGAMSYRPT